MRTFAAALIAVAITAQACVARSTRALTTLRRAFRPAVRADRKIRLATWP